MRSSVFSIEYDREALGVRGVLATLPSLTLRAAVLSLLWLWMAAIAFQSPLQAAEESPARNPAASQGPSEIQLLTEGWALAPEDVAVLERRLTKKPVDLRARMLLISYYFQHADRAPRLRHIYWMIENDPDSNLFDFRGTGIHAFESRLGSPDDFQHARELWLEQVKRHPRSPRVHANAARMLEQDDPEKAEEFWRWARSLEPNNRRWTFFLGRLYGSVIRTDGRINPRTPVVCRTASLCKSGPGRTEDIERYGPHRQSRRGSHSAGWFRAGTSDELGKGVLATTPGHVGTGRRLATARS